MATKKPAPPPKEDTPASHFGLASRVRQLVDGVRVPPLPNPYDLMLPRSAPSRLPGGVLVGEGHKMTTANYEAMAIAVELVRLWRGGPPPKWIPASAAAEYLAFSRQRAVDLLKEELGRGLMRGEQLAVDPHAELHLAPIALLRIGALAAGDKELLRLLDEWFARYLDVATACVTPGGVLCHAGARSRAHPVSEVGAAICAEVTRCAPLREPGKSSTALDAVRQLIRVGDDFGGRLRRAPERDAHAVAMGRLGRVELAYPMVVERGLDWVRSYVPDPPARDFHLRELFASCVLVRFGKERSAGQLLKAGKLEVIRGWTAPAPPPPSRPVWTARTL